MSLFDTVSINQRNLLKLLLDQPWHEKCEIIPDYMPPFPSKDTVPTVQIRYNNGTEYMPFLRFSNGPLADYFWDIYGSDMYSVEVAILVLSKAPPPRDVSPITFTIPLRQVS